MHSNRKVSSLKLNRWAMDFSNGRFVSSRIDFIRCSFFSYQFDDFYCNIVPRKLFFLMTIAIPRMYFTWEVEKEG